MKAIKLGVIGCGNMAQAIIKSLVKESRETFAREEIELTITVSDKDESKTDAVKDVCAVTKNNADVQKADYVLLAIKPQNAAEAVANVDLSQTTVLSIMAGMTVKQLEELTHSKKIVRIMPNLNASVAKSFSAYVTKGDVDKSVVELILNAFGECAPVDESEMDAITGITGSGPAFVFMTLQAFYEKAKEEGFDSATAKKMAVQTVIGSALNYANQSRSVEEMTDAVCSKGGTTIEGVNVLREKEYVDTLKKAIGASINRSREMSGGKTVKVSVEKGATNEGANACKKGCAPKKIAQDCNRETSEIKSLEIYTDGACSGNPGKGGWCAIVLYKGVEKVLSGADAETTNNRMELQAVVEGLKALTEPCKVKLYSDSAYVVNGTAQWLKGWKRNGWQTSDGKAVKNRDLWESIDEQINIHAVTFIKVKGHSDNEYNNKCDEYARAAIATLSE